MNSHMHVLPVRGYQLVVCIVCNFENQSPVLSMARTVAMLCLNYLVEDDLGYSHFRLSHALTTSCCGMSGYS